MTPQQEETAGAQSDEVRAPRYRVDRANFERDFLPIYRHFFEPLYIVQFPIHLPFAAPLPEGRTLTIPFGDDVALSYVFTSRRVDVSASLQPGDLDDVPLARVVTRTRVEMVYATGTDLPADRELALTSVFDVLLHNLNHLITAYRVLFKDPDACRLTRPMLQPQCLWRVVDVRAWEPEEGVFLLHFDVPYDRELLSEEDVQLLGWYTMVSLQQYNPFMASLELQLDARREVKDGFYRNAIMHAQTAVESFLSQLLTQLLLSEGMAASDVEAKLDKLPFMPMVRNEFAGRIGGDWEPNVAPTVIGQWKSDCYAVRNAVVHEGYDASYAETEAAIAAAEAFVAYVITLVNKAGPPYDSIKGFFSTPQAPEVETGEEPSR
jgi:hypothetical protein